MAKHVASLLIISIASMGAVIGCDNNSSDKNATADVTQTTPTSATGAPTAIDWSAVSGDEKAAPRADYNYPFAIDSQNVRDYADYFKVDNATAQHNLTVSMASNEALSKVLDQLSTSYVSHELTDTKDMTLIIHTTPDVAAGSYDYVFTGDFAKGLVLPIVIQPNGKKGEVKGHGKVAE